MLSEGEGLLVLAVAALSVMRDGAKMGSGPSTTKLAGAALLVDVVAALTTACVPADSQVSVRAAIGLLFCARLEATAGRITKPSGVACQIKATPLVRDCARAASKTATKRCDSRSSCVWLLSRSDKLTRPTANPMMASTTNSSNRVRPCWRCMTGLSIRFIASCRGRRFCLRRRVGRQRRVTAHPLHLSRRGSCIGKGGPMGRWAACRCRASSSAAWGPPWA
jgi:hypothetical protein